MPFQNLLITGCLLIAASVTADTLTVVEDSSSPPPPCAIEEMRQFDFWIGEWNLTWGDSGTGINIITSELSNCVIEENFTTLGDKPFIGNSLSSYNSRTGKWHQTWVDNTGSYLDFVGAFADDKMILSREATDKDGNLFLQRMVWFNIYEPSLDWHWEKSIDSGKNWSTSWAIHYERK